MKLTEHIYKISGTEYGTNSSSYAVAYDGGICLIDCGYGQKQWNCMIDVLKNWGLNMENVTHVFLTHTHFDHCRNAARVNALGAKLYVSEEGVPFIEDGNPESEQMFHAEWIPAKVDGIVHDGEVFSFPGGLRITCAAAPGHSRSSVIYLIETDGIRAAAIGDMFWPVPLSPEDALDAEIGYMGSSDASYTDYLDSVRKLRQLSPDLLLTGHYYTAFGSAAEELLAKAEEKAKTTI